MTLNERVEEDMSNETRRLTERQVKSALDRFNLPARVEAYLATLGPLLWRRPANLAHVPWEARLPNAGPARLREYVVLTKCGPLGVSIYDDWIACVFDDARAPGASWPSGKWNHHAFVRYCHKPTDPQSMVWRLNTMLDGFVASVEAITLDRTLPEAHEAAGWLKG